MDDFKTMAEKATEKRHPLAYCDYIAALISDDLKAFDCQNARLLLEVSRPQSDLHPEQGYLVSTKKTLMVQDKQNKLYKIIVEEL